MKYLPGFTLCIVGEKEKIGSDLAMCCPLALLSDDKSPFLHLTDGRYDYTTENITPAMRVTLDQAFINPMVHDTVRYVNSQCSYITGYGCSANWFMNLGTYTLGLVPNSKISTLKSCSYGLTQWEGLDIYGSTPPPKRVCNGDCTTADLKFDPTLDNSIFDMSGSQKIKVALSGSGLGYGGSSPGAGTPNEFPIPVPPQTWWSTSPAGEESTNYGIVGFTSTTPYYISFSGTTASGPLGVINRPSPFPALLPDSTYNAASRYLISKPISDINIAGLSSWDQVVSVSITWIAGNKTNGGDIPDVNGFSVSLPGNQRWIPPFRRAENLSAEFLDEDYNSIAKVDLWKTKPNPTPAQISYALANGTSVFSAPGMPNGVAKYVGNTFTTTTINYVSFGGSLTNAKYFVIRQPFGTWYLDTYGVSDVKFEFDMD